MDQIHRPNSKRAKMASKDSNSPSQNPEYKKVFGFDILEPGLWVAVSIRHKKTNDLWSFTQVFPGIVADLEEPNALAVVDDEIVNNKWIGTILFNGERIGRFLARLEHPRIDYGTVYTDRKTNTPDVMALTQDPVDSNMIWYVTPEGGQAPRLVIKTISKANWIERIRGLVKSGYVASAGSGGNSRVLNFSKTNLEV